MSYARDGSVGGSVRLMLFIPGSIICWLYVQLVWCHRCGCPCVKIFVTSNKKRVIMNRVLCSVYNKGFVLMCYCVQFLASLSGVCAEGASGHDVHMYDTSWYRLIVTIGGT